MLRYEELQQLSEDRTRQLRREADAERRTVRASGRCRQRRERRALQDAFELLTRAWRPA
jgi:hypothetical protein